MHNENNPYYFYLSRDLHEYIMRHLTPKRQWIVVEEYGCNGIEYQLAYRDSDEPIGLHHIDSDYPPYSNRNTAIRIMTALNAE